MNLKALYLCWTNTILILKEANTDYFLFCKKFPTLTFTQFYKVNQSNFLG